MQGRTFSVLDGIRGVSALVVVFYHLETAQLSNNIVFHSGYLAVDLFFLMSGFVIAYAYEKKLIGGMYLSDFMVTRGIRLYPVYLLSTIFGLFVAIAASLLSKDPERLSEAFVSLPFALLAIPHLSADGLTWFPLAPPAWSLFYEVLLNFAYALLIQHLSDKRLALATVGSLSILTVLIAFNGGVDGVGPLRCIFGISAGVLLYRKWSGGLLPLAKFPIYVPLLGTLFVTMLPSEGAWCLLTVPVALAVLFPLIVLTAINQQPSELVTKTMMYLGALSYPIYLLHWPILLTVRKAASFGELTIVQQDILTISGTIITSALILRFYDEPIRSIIANRKKGKIISC